jgi:hypothetical protein
MICDLVAPTDGGVAVRAKRKRDADELAVPVVLFCCNNPAVSLSQTKLQTAYVGLHTGQ